MAWRKVQLLPSEARTATEASAVQKTPNIERLIVFIDATASAATPSVVFTIRGYAPKADGTPETYDLLASAAVTGTGNTKLEVGPGITAAANAAAQIAVPGEWDVNAAHANGDSIMYSVSAWVYERP